MADQPRRVEPATSSPKSSPRGSRSPAYPRTDSTGTLKTTISLGKVPSVIHSGPFYLMKDVPDQAEMTGYTNLMSYHGLGNSYNKFFTKKVKEELSAFLPNLPGNIDSPGLNDASSLRSVIEKPPITVRELMPLSGASLTGFRLHPGPSKKEIGKDGSMQEIQGENSSDAAHDKKKKVKRTEEEKEKKKRKKKKKKKHSPEHPSSVPPSSEIAP
ncbi:MED19 [Acanthosepion pharaonis]|uniref:Mediator of RNA polymerase II transcription subunit 19 n=1 Tax=Acanthosepion pharaonis TaxID=158019 RepID=A0A812CDJ1_ACAPH|nr:MED19 [Sepia pharaonis]